MKAGIRLDTGWLAGLLFLLACGGSSPTDGTPPNLVVVSIDTLRADHVGAYGYSQPTTPRIDAFAREAVVFERCFAHAPSTLASHASLFTSLLPEHHGASIARETQLAPSARTLAEILSDAGYRTASFNGGIQLDAAYGIARGFDVYESAQARSSKLATLEGKDNRLASAVSRARDWLELTEPPFFLFLHSYEIHHPYTPRREDLAHFRGDYAGPLPDNTSMKTLREVNFGGRWLSPADAAHVVATYDAELRSADTAFGELLELLRERGLENETVVVLTSDHGEEFGERGKMGWHSHTLFDELLHVPLVVRFAEAQWGGTRVAAQVRVLDVAPTLLNALGLPNAPSFAGSSLLPLLEGAPPSSRPLLATLDSRDEPPPRTLRTETWKLSSRGDRLYDLTVDPAERRNVAGRHPAIVRELRSRSAELSEAREAPEQTPAAPREETVRQLRELGYVE